MKKVNIKNRNVTILSRWMREISWVDHETGNEEHLTGARLLLWARIWTLSQDSPYGVRAADIGVWAGLAKDAAQRNLDYMVEHGLLQRVTMIQGYGYTAVGPEADRDSDDSYEVKGWMVSKIGLKNATEIIAYAIIYRDRHRRDGFYGSPAYIAGWAGCAERAVQYALSRMQSCGMHGTLVLTHWAYDSKGRRRLARKPNPEIFTKWVEAATNETRAVNPDAFERLEADRRAGHRRVERNYKDGARAIANDMIEDMRERGEWHD